LALFTKKEKSGGLEVRQSHRSKAEPHINVKDAGIGISKDSTHGVGIGAKPFSLKAKRMRA
jgi:hypothetical protein